METHNLISVWLNVELYMKKALLSIFLFITIFTSGCIGDMLAGDVTISSEPEGAAVYLDSEYKGQTPCAVNNLPSGTHLLQLRHNKFPTWEKEIEVEIGKKLDVTANLYENIIPKISLAYDGSGSYAIGDTIQLSGTAETVDNSVILRILQTSGSYPRYDNTYRIPIDDDFHYKHHLQTGNLRDGEYRISASLSTGESKSVSIIIQSESQTNAEIVKQIVENYHKSHTYSHADFFICADMALDVWNMVKTEGINAKIAIGDVQRSNEQLFEANHAWVIAEISSDNWLALETTGGYTVPDNKEYYKGWFFESSRGFKTYLTLIEQYNSQLGRIKAAETRYNQKTSEYNSEAASLTRLINSYNRNYAGKSLSPAQYQASLYAETQITNQEAIVARSIGELNQASEYLESEYSTLQKIKKEMMDQID